MKGVTEGYQPELTKAGCFMLKNAEHAVWYSTIQAHCSHNRDITSALQGNSNSSKFLSRNLLPYIVLQKVFKVKERSR